MDEFSQFAGRPFEVVDVATPEVLVGGLFGVGMVFAFAGMAIAAVGRAAQRVVLICREAFKSDPGILAGTSLPNYERVVSVVTQAALSEMVAPGVLCVGAPVAVGFAGRFVGELCGNRPGAGAPAVFLGDDVAVLARSSGEDSPRHRAGVASMAEDIDDSHERCKF